MSANPIDGFTIDRNAITFLGQGLQRPECILAEPDGSLWSADARGGVVQIRPDGTQTLVTQSVTAGFASAISGFDTHDRIVINSLSGDDVINASGLGADVLAYRQWRRWQ